MEFMFQKSTGSLIYLFFSKFLQVFIEGMIKKSTGKIPSTKNFPKLSFFFIKYFLVEFNCQAVG